MLPLQDYAHPWGVSALTHVSHESPPKGEPMETEVEPEPESPTEKIRLKSRPTDDERIKVCDRFRVLESHGALKGSLDDHMQEAMDCMSRKKLKGLIAPYADYPAKAVKGPQGSPLSRVVNQIHEARRKGQLTAEETDLLQTEAEELDPVEIYKWAWKHNLDPLSKQERAAELARHKRNGNGVAAGVIGALVFALAPMGLIGSHFHLVPIAIVVGIMIFGAAMLAWAIAWEHLPKPQIWIEDSQHGEYINHKYVYEKIWRIGQLRTVALHRVHRAKMSWLIASPFIMAALFFYSYLLLSKIF